MEEIKGRGRRVRVYFGESDRHEGRPLWSALLDTLRRNGAAGATILRGMASFGAQSRVHASTDVDLSADLPLVLEWIDSDELVEALLATIAGMIDGGIVTSEPIDIVRYTAHEATGRH